MKKTIFLTLTAAVIIPLLILSCGMGLEPAKSGETSVSFSFASLPGFEPMASSGRAIFPGGGSLYIKMESPSTVSGGASEESQPNIIGSEGQTGELETSLGGSNYYGPYTIPRTGKATITITEIPAGSYAAMKLLYTPVTGLSEEFVNQIFSEDVDFGEEEGVEGESPTTEQILFAIRSSVGLVEDCVIQEGEQNSFPVTMMPITPAEVTPSDMLDGLYFESTTDFNGFIGISELTEPFADINLLATFLKPIADEYIKDNPLFELTPGLEISASKDLKFLCRVNNTSGKMNIKSFAFYDEEGRLIEKENVKYESPDASIGAQKFSVPYVDGDEMFMYLNISGGNPEISIEPTSGLFKIFTKISGTLILSGHSEKFNGVESVVFSENYPSANEPSIVGVALAKSPIDNLYSLNGYLSKGSLDKELYLTIKGKKDGVDVEYVADVAYPQKIGVETAIDLSNIRLTSLEENPF